MAGLHWSITIQISCESCGDRRVRTVRYVSSYKGMLVEEECDELRTDFLTDLEVFERWQVSGLDTWESDGVFTCRECVEKSLPLFTDATEEKENISVNG